MLSPLDTQTEAVLLKVILQLMVIIAAARLGAVAFRFLGQPQVCGEIAAGLVLGPTFLGRLFPDLSGRIFDPTVAPIVSTLSQIGLILLMFLIGLEFNFAHLRSSRRAALTISLAGIAVPFTLGLLLAPYLHARIGIEGNPLNFSLFLATALSITALPILGRIMIELNIHRTRIAAITITAAALDDVAGWIILALVTAIVRSRFDPASFALMLFETVGYALVLIFVVRPVLRRWARSAVGARDGELSLGALATLLVLIFTSAAVTNLIGIFSIFGAFLIGAVLYDEDAFREAVKRRLHDFVVAFFLPIFFTYTGLRTDIGTLQGASMWVLCALVLLAALIGKLGGCTAAALLAGFRVREAALVGVLMNTRALMELIVINIGYDLGVIPKSVFFMLVFMAIVTTYMTTPIVRRLIVATELEPEFQRSTFARQPRKAVD
ncbi:MAG: hypothetical protein A3H95_04795 [Acidobacteria bacterium RIFCSPLOWO2_02_FULL_64_15]|nr:MAG: hypothetical protein A3H95_04795 [Acidobacteria bacterium RIFCSPLOWO2_02_FULL_64_15]